jgi:hypothetical protein
MQVSAMCDVSIFAHNIENVMGHSDKSVYFLFLFFTNPQCLFRMMSSALPVVQLQFHYHSNKVDFVTVGYSVPVSKFSMLHITDLVLGVLYCSSDTVLERKNLIPMPRAPKLNNHWSFHSSVYKAQLPPCLAHQRRISKRAINAHS